MKKSSLFILSLVVVSCGKYPIGNSTVSSVGQQISINTQLSVSDVDRTSLTAICNSLSLKQSRLPSGVGQSFVYLTGQADCGSSTITPAPVGVTIATRASNFIFVRKDNNMDYVFPDVETTTSGVMADICPNLNNSTFTNPIVNNQTNQRTFFYTTGISNKDCPTVAGETCIRFQQALPVGADQLQVQSEEFIRFRTNTTLTKVGFFTFRKKVAQAFCAQNQFFTTQAQLQE